MGVGPAEARGLSIWEYTAMLHEWGEAHSSEDEPAPPPEEDFVRRRHARLAEIGVGSIH